MGEPDDPEAPGAEAALEAVAVQDEDLGRAREASGAPRQSAPSPRRESAPPPRFAAGRSPPARCKRAVRGGARQRSGANGILRASARRARSSFLSFFDEGDEPTRVRRPPRPRRPGHRLPRGRRRRGHHAAETARPHGRARSSRVGIALLVFILLAIGVNSCRNSAKENGLKDYNRNVTAVIKDSDAAGRGPVLRAAEQRPAPVLGPPPPGQPAARAGRRRSQAREGLRRAGDMTAAQRNLELVLGLRDEGLRRIAEQIPAALGRGQASTQAIGNISAQMQSFLASDVVYSQRVAPLIRDGLDNAGVSGQAIAGSRFIPDVSWLAPATVATKLGRGTGATAGATGAVAPGLHGHGITSVTAGSVTLQPGGTINRVPVRQRQLHGQLRQPGRQRRAERQGRPARARRRQSIVQNKTIGTTKSKQNASVTIPLGQSPPVGQAATVTVRRARCRREEHDEQPPAVHRDLHALT